MKNTTIWRPNQTAREFFDSGEFQQLLAEAGSRFVSVTNETRDGRERTYTFNPAQLKSRSRFEFIDPKGKPRYNLRERGNFNVIESQKIGAVRRGNERTPVRTIRFDTVKRIRANGTTYLFANS